MKNLRPQATKRDIYPMRDKQLFCLHFGPNEGKYLCTVREKARVLVAFELGMKAMFAFVFTDECINRNTNHQKCVTMIV